jgi:thioredoxin 2
MGSESTAETTASETAASGVVLVCGACGARNLTPGSELATTRQCPKCDATLTPLATPLDVDANELAALVISARVPVLIDFWAPWCPPCRLAGPIVKKVAENLKGKALVLKVDTEQQPALAAEFGIRAIPTFVVIRDRKVVRQHPGLAMPGTIKRWLSASAPTATPRARR